ncbi:MAG: 6-pyruvoyl trahydropterin synthase family protein, partial [Bacteroidota bacterium]
MEVSVSRKAHFNAAHRLHVNEWTDEQNRIFFGMCNNANFHGHNYELIVTVTGEVDPISGYLMDMKVLKDIIQSEVEEKFDHRNLNMDTEEFRNLNPTAENIAIVIWRLIKAKLE